MSAKPAIALVVLVFAAAACGRAGSSGSSTAAPAHATRPGQASTHADAATSSCNPPGAADAAERLANDLVPMRYDQEHRILLTIAADLADDGTESGARDMVLQYQQIWPRVVATKQIVTFHATKVHRETGPCVILEYLVSGHEDDHSVDHSGGRVMTVHRSGPVVYDVTVMKVGGVWKSTGIPSPDDVSKLVTR